MEDLEYYKDLVEYYKTDYVVLTNLHRKINEAGFVVDKPLDEWVLEKLGIQEEKS